VLRLSSPLLCIAVVAFAVAFAPTAKAAGQRTFVASNGLPGNTAFNCSIAKPCRAFSEAIGVTNPGGEVIVLDSAGYGPVLITKSVSLISPPGIYAGISVFAGDGVTVNAPGAIVVLRGLSINGQGGSRGIHLQSAARVRVENCVISGMGAAGIAHNAAGGEMIVQDTIVRDTGGSGIVVVGDLPSAVLDHVRSEHGGGDGFSFAPTAGSLGARATIIDSVFAYNAGKGIGAGSLAGATITVVVERSVMSYNGQDGFAATSGAGSAVATLTRNAINDNGGNGIWMQGNTLGAASENAVHRNSGYGIFVDGAAAQVRIAANTMSQNLVYDVYCNGSQSQLSSLANNIVFSYLSPGGCYVADAINFGR
jgi:hypothetical protein